MDSSEVISVAIFCFTMVFSLLAVIYFLIRISTSVIKFIAARVKPKTEE